MRAICLELLGVVEDAVAAGDWPWNLAVSLFLDDLVLLIEMEASW